MAFVPPNIPQGQTRTEAFLAPISKAVSGFPDLLLQWQKFKKERELQRAQYGNLGTEELQLPGITPTGEEFQVMTPPQKLNAFGTAGTIAMREGSQAATPRMQKVGVTPDGKTVSFHPTLAYNVVEGSTEPYRGEILPFIDPADRGTEIPGGEAGRAALAFQSGEVSLPGAKAILFPDGTPQSFRADVALKARLPFYGGPLPKDTDAQNLYRFLFDSTAAKILIQTGVAARPEEVQAEIKKFIPNFLSDAQATMDGLDQLGQFYEIFLHTLKNKSLPERGSLNKPQTLAAPPAAGSGESPEQRKARLLAELKGRR